MSAGVCAAQPVLACPGLSLPHLVIEALKEGGLQLWHEGLQAWPGPPDEQPEGDQDGGLGAEAGTCPR